ncbi:MAG: hypothetical protein ACYCW6_16935 [Candidatus Xenobia bacterium]
MLWVAPVSAALKVTMLFPLADNEGKAFDHNVWDWWLDEIALRFDACTDLGNVQGYWEGYSDHHRMIVMVLPESELRNVRLFLQEAGVRFRQEAMYLDYHPVVLELI